MTFRSVFDICLVAFLMTIGSLAAECEEGDSFDEALLSRYARSVELSKPDDAGAAAIPMANLEGEPSALISGHVNVITGDYNDFEVDLSLPGIDKLTIERSFCGSTSRPGTIAAGWNVNHYGTLCSHHYKEGGKRRFSAVVRESHGGKSIYEKILDKKGEEIRNTPLSKSVYEKGVTNTSSGYISGQTNIKNGKVSKPDRKSYRIRSGDGGHKDYRKPAEWSVCHCLYKEVKPSGNRTKYRYLKQGEQPFGSPVPYRDEVTNVELKSSDERLLASLAFFPAEYKKNKKGKKDKTNFETVVEACDGSFVRYHNEVVLKGSRAYESLLTKIERSCSPTETYKYIANAQKDGFLVHRKGRPDGHYIEVGYYGWGKNQIGKDVEKVSGSRDHRLNRVMVLKAPVGVDSTPIDTHHFFYEFDSDKKGKKPKEISGGNTTVLDALGHKTLYTYGKDDRLKHLDKFSRNGNLYSRESLFWGDKDSELSTYLLTRTLQDASGSIVFAKAHNYDGAGNVVQNTLYGNLSGHNQMAPQVSLDGTVLENGCESYQKHCEYSGDAFNLLLSETDGIQETRYEYDWMSNRVRAKFTGAPGKILVREFYEYNTDAAVTKTIVDDGNTTDPSNLSGVTERQITYLTPRSSFPFGLTEIMVQKYLDLTTGEEVLISKTINCHNNRGSLTKQEIYDNQEMLVASLSFDYDEMGNLVRETDPLGQVKEWRYDANCNCIFEQGVNPNLHKTYTYDFANRLIREDHIHQDGVSQSSSYSYNVLSQLTNILDNRGNETRYRYDAFGRVVKIIAPATLDAAGHVITSVVKRGYDLMGNITRVVDPSDNATLTTYTLRGQPATISYPDGTRVTNTYNKNGTLSSSCAANGTVSSYSYDPLGRVTATKVTSQTGELLSSTSATYSSFHLLSETDAMGQVTTYSYYGDGKLKSKESSTSQQFYTYDSLGHLSATSDYAGPGSDGVTVKVQEHDVLGRLIEERTQDGAGFILTQVSYAYDCSGNVIEVRSSEGDTTRTIFDSHGTPVVSIDAEGNQTLTKQRDDTVNALGQCVQTTEVIDALGNMAVTVADAMGRVSSIVRKNTMGEVTQQQEVFYDCNGNKARLVDTIFSDNNPSRSVVTTWDYDCMNRILSCCEAAGTLEQKRVSIAYNIYGQKATFTKACGTVVSYTYDALGRLASWSSSDGTIHYTYHYNKKSQPVLVEDLIHHVSTSKSYDEAGHLANESLGNGVEISYQYDGLGRPIEVSLPDIGAFAFSYHSCFLKKAARLDLNGNILYEHVYKTYDLSGRLRESCLIGDAGTLHSSYDRTGRLKSTTSDHWEENLNYDAVHNITDYSQEDSLGAVTTSYRYDDLYQLIDERGGASRHQYKYDSHYNRTEKDGRLHTHNSLNQLLDDGKARYTYDANGNLTKKITSTQTTEYGYDALDRLTTLTEPLRQFHYRYDEENRRLSKQAFAKDDNGNWAEQSIVYYLYQGQNEIGSLDSDGNLIDLRLLGSGKGAEIGAAVATEVNGKAYAPIHNHSGHLVILLDLDTRAPIETYRYTAFGEELFDKAISPWRFSSKRVDEESGFVYFGRRYYDPDIGRWISQDPINRAGGPNLYAYILNSPLTNIDLYGLYSTSSSNSGNYSESGCSPNGMQFNNSYGAFCDIWRQQCPIPILRDCFSAVNHYMNHGCFCNYKMEYQEEHCRNGQVYGLDLYKNHAIVYVPGVNNTFASTREAAEYISRAFGDSSVYYCGHNSSGVLSGLVETGCQKADIQTESVSYLVDLVKRKLADVGPQGTVSILGFSQGGQMIDNLRNHFSPEQLKQLHLVTLGSAKMVSEKNFGSAINYVSTRDPIPYTADSLGMIKSCFCRDIQVEFVSSNSLPFTDHAIMNDSYQGVITRLGHNFIKNYLSEAVK